MKITKNKYLSPNYLKAYVGVILIATSVYIYKFIYNPNIYLMCISYPDENISYYKINRSNFYWLFDRRTQKFKYSKKVKEFKRNSIEIDNPNDLARPGNNQWVYIDRLTGDMVFYYFSSTNEQKESKYRCMNIKSLPERVKPQF